MARLPWLRSFRIVAEEPLHSSVEALLHAEGYEFEPEPFSPFCRRLVHEPAPLGSSLAAFFGYIYIQDRSSMLPPLALAPRPGDSVLDMCASPGSKTGFLAQLVTRQGFVLGNEPNPSRLASLRANLQIANLLNVGTCSYAGEKLPLLPETWGCILLDPPCSGWGTVAKNPAASRIWRGSKIDRLVSLQKRLLRRAAQLLAPGGTLVYSTCTTNFDENEAQVEYAQSELGLQLGSMEPFEGFSYESEDSGYLKVNGTESAAQGFFIARLRKPGVAPDAAAATHRGATMISPQTLTRPTFDPELLPPGQTAVFNGKLRFLPRNAAQLLPAGFTWKGAYLGTVNPQYIFLDPRLRVTLPRDDGAQIVVDEVSELRAILAGQSRKYQTALSHTALWWRNLPLGSVGLKNGRLIIAFR